MHILITRHRYKPATIDGQLSIDGIRICDCAENAHTALPPGIYSITIVHCRQYARKMPLITPISNQSSVINNRICPMLKPGNGVYHREDGSILVGEYLVPGCLKHSRFTFDNLYDRIRKNLQRGKEVTLTIR
ncbi:MAG: DUF5675 family protein [Bacteroidales bacterium]|nr:DUF5675 family protein [Bacteroidales bacterium]